MGDFPFPCFFFFFYGLYMNCIQLRMVQRFLKLFWQLNSPCCILSLYLGTNCITG